MPAAKTTIPDSFRFALRRYDKAPEIPMRVSGYDEQVVSRNVEVRGRAAPTIFIHSKYFRDRLVKLGWKDETEALREERGRRREASKLEDETLKDLRKRARSAGVSRYSRMSKADLVEALAAEAA